MMDAIAQHLIAGMFRDHLVAANEMARIGNFPMARLELSSATETLAQLEALQPDPSPTPTGLHHSAQGCEPRATLGNPINNPSNPERVEPPIDV